MTPRARRVATAAVVLALAIGCNVKPASTPESAFAELQKASASGDHGAVFDLMSSTTQKEFASLVSAAAERMKELPPFARQLIGFDFAEIAKLPPRDAFIKVASGAKEVGKLGEAMTGKAADEVAKYASATVKESKIEGDSATLTVEMDGTAVTLRLVREAGVWKFTSGLWPDLGK